MAGELIDLGNAVGGVATTSSQVLTLPSTGKGEVPGAPSAGTARVCVTGAYPVFLKFERSASVSASVSDSTPFLPGAAEIVQIRGMTHCAIVTEQFSSRVSITLCEGEV